MCPEPGEGGGKSLEVGLESLADNRRCCDYGWVKLKIVELFLQLMGNS